MVWDVMAMLHTGNWQVNVLAWYSLGKPKKILLFVGEKMESDKCREFFISKGCLPDDIMVCETKLKFRQSPHTHQKIIKDFICLKLESGNTTCVLFRSAAKHLMREGMLFAYQELIKDPAWQKRLASAVLDEEIFLEQAGKAPEWGSIKAPELELKDYVTIAGYFMVCDTNQDMPEEWQKAYQNLQCEASLADLWGACVNLVEHCERAHQWEGKASIDGLSSDLRERLPSIAQFFPHALQENQQFLNVPTLLKYKKPWERYSQWIGLLWEQIFADLWLTKQLEKKFGKSTTAYQLYRNAKIKIAEKGDDLTELDYVVLFPNGKLLLIECKVDIKAAGKPQQAEIRNRLADKLTGQPIQTCFLLPAQDINEQQAIETDMDKKYPKDLGFATIAACLDNIEDTHRRLADILENLTKKQE